jgi:hypothetical protein
MMVQAFETLINPLQLAPSVALFVVPNDKVDDFATACGHLKRGQHPRYHEVSNLMEIIYKY